MRAANLLILFTPLLQRISWLCTLCHLLKQKLISSRIFFIISEMYFDSTSSTSLTFLQDPAAINPRNLLFLGATFQPSFSDLSILQIRFSFYNPDQRRILQQVASTIFPSFSHPQNSLLNTHTNAYRLSWVTVSKNKHNEPKLVEENINTS